MIFNYDFDIAALFIEFIVIFFYFYKKKVPSNQGRTFFSIVIIGVGHENFKLIKHFALPLLFLENSGKIN